MAGRSWPSDNERRDIQKQLNDCLRFVKDRLKKKVSPPAYLRCLWIENQLDACQAALDSGNRKEVETLLYEIDWRIVELYKSP
jgi:hypothetical protein